MPCSRCGRAPCGCTQVGVGSPKPYYKDPQGVVTPENHVHTIIEPRYSAAVQVANDWNVPLVGQDTVLEVPNLENVLVSAYIYNQSYGFFQVMGYNDQTKQLIVANTGIPGNQSPGSYVPACTNFIFAPPPCCTTDDDTPYPYVAEDFAEPIGVGESVTIKVTSVATLSIGSFYHIGPQTYRLDAIGSGREITITMQSGGPAPGFIQAKDADGFFQYPISVATTEACDASTVSEVSLLGCSSGVERILDVSGVDQVPVATNATNNTVRMKYLDTTPRICTNTSTLLTLTNGQTTIASLQVASTTGFVLGDVLQIAFGTLRYTVTNVIDGTHLALTIDPAATAQSIGAGAFVCIILTSELIQSEVSDITDALDGLTDSLAQSVDQKTTSNDFGSLNGGGASSYPLTLDSDNDEILSEHDEVIVQNTSATKDMLVLLDIDLRVRSYFDKPGSGDDYGYLEIALQAWSAQGAIGTAANPAGSLADDGPIQKLFTGNSTAYEDHTPMDYSMHRSYHYTIAPGDEIKVAARGRVKRISASQDIVVEEIWVDTRIIGFAVA